MSNSKHPEPPPAETAAHAPAQAGGGGGFNLAEPQMTATQFQNQQEFFFAQVERFKKMFEDSTLAKFIIMAGISGVVLAVIEVVRVFIDVVVYFKK